MKILVTGSSGLIGSEVCLFFASRGCQIHGVDNNQRAVFFGPQGDTRWNQERIANLIRSYVHHELDIRDRQAVMNLVAEIKPDAIIHTAAQPSHDRAAAIPFDDFDTNAVGSLNFLEAARRSCPESPFIHMSTNKVYGDRPNTLPLIELETRWEYGDPAFVEGIAEDFSIDQSKHSLFRCLQSRSRCDGAGVRPLFRDAHLLPAGRVSDRPEPLGRRTPWGFLATS
jgi:CDP-paratose 2-epimerase